jgi:hypothetical protein
MRETKFHTHTKQQPKVFLSTLFSDHSAHVPPSMRETKFHTHTKQQPKVQSFLLLGIICGSDGFSNRLVHAIDCNPSGPRPISEKHKNPYSVSNTEHFRMPSKKVAASRQLLGNR